MERLNLEQFLRPPDTSGLDRAFAASVAPRDNSVWDTYMAAQSKDKDRAAQAALAQQQIAAEMEQARLRDAQARYGVDSTAATARQKADDERAVIAGKLIEEHQNEADPARRAAIESHLNSLGVSVEDIPDTRATVPMGVGTVDPNAPPPSVQMDPKLASVGSPMGMGAGIVRPPGDQSLQLDPSLAAPAQQGFKPTYLGVGGGAPSLQIEDAITPSENGPPGQFFMFRGQPIAPTRTSLADVQQARATQARSQFAPFLKGGTPIEQDAFAKASEGAASGAAAGLPVDKAIGNAADSASQMFNNRRADVQAAGRAASGVRVELGQDLQREKFIAEQYGKVNPKPEDSVAKYKAMKWANDEIAKAGNGIVQNRVLFEMAKQANGAGVLTDKDFIRSVGGGDVITRIEEWLSQSGEGEMSEDMRRRVQVGLKSYYEVAKQKLKDDMRKSQFFIDSQAAAPARDILQAQHDANYRPYADLLNEQQGKPASPVGPKAPAAQPPPAPREKTPKEAPGQMKTPSKPLKDWGKEYDAETQSLLDELRKGGK